jgi:hypothetical protein
VDLGDQILEVLDDPSMVWARILDNMAAGPRNCFLVLATCLTPITTTEWQDAVGRVDVPAALHFEASMRVLDDTFTTSRRRRGGSFEVDYLNPSIDDLAASYLDKHVAMVGNVIASGATNAQIQRLLNIASATTLANSVTRWRYDNLYRIVIASPAPLIETLAGRLTDDSSNPALDQQRVLTLIVSLLWRTGKPMEHITPALASSLQAKLEALSLSAWGRRFTRSLFAEAGRVRTLQQILPRPLVIYGNLVAASSSLADYESLMNWDLAIGRPGGEVPWRDEFFDSHASLLEDFDDPDDDSPNLYKQVLQYLDLYDLSLVNEWEERENELRDSDRQMNSGDEDVGDPWSEADETHWRAQRNSAAAEQADSMTIEAMFSGFLRTESP